MGSRWNQKTIDIPETNELFQIWNPVRLQNQTPWFNIWIPDFISGIEDSAATPEDALRENTCKPTWHGTLGIT